MNLVLNPEALRRAADLQEQIVELQNEINELMSGTVDVSNVARSTSTGGGQRKGKRTLSPAAIAKIRKGQRERWAKVHAAQAAQANAATTPAAAPATATPAPAAAASAPAPAQAQPKSEKPALVAA